jgi:DNA-binding NarL/FixJ family response regulator
MKLIRVLLADDHPLVVAGLRSLLEAECEVVGVVSDGRSLVEAVSRLKPGNGGECRLPGEPLRQPS